MTKRIASGRIISAFFVVAALGAAGCSTVKTESAVAGQAVTQPADLSTFFNLAHQAHLDDVINGSAPVTVFAPTNDAFQAMPAATLDKLAKDPEQLKALLSYHIVPGKLLAQNVTENTMVPTLNGAKVNVSKAGDFLTLDEAMVSEGDIPTGNGVLHKIDRVLTPPSAKK
ncbi:MAG TPA: fasciclin domain-containing protein [Aquabacterium sp.]|nr:fasciclin domain-containing protein [Aquabacterium sp.]